MLLRLFFVFTITSLTILQMGCGLFGIGGSSSASSTPTISDSDSSISHIEISPNIQSIPLGSPIQLQATAIFSDKSKKNISDTVNWDVKDNNIGNITTAGYFTSQETGTTSITASFEEYATVIDVTIKQVELIALNIHPINPHVDIDTIVNLDVIGIYNDGSRINLSDQVTWAQSDSSVLDISVAPNVSTLITGTSIVTATFGSVSNSIAIKVSDKELLDILIETSEDRFYIDTPVTIKAIGIYADNSKQNISDSVSWTFSESSLVDFKTETKTITPLLEGQVTVSASLNKISSSKTIDLIKPTLTFLEINPQQANIAINGTQFMKCIATYDNGDSVDVTKIVTWSSNADDVASIENGEGFEGKLTARTAGTAEISVTLNNVSATSLITIEPASLTKIEVSLRKQKIAVGTTARLYATGIYDNGLTNDLTNQVIWESQSPDIAQVNNAFNEEGKVNTLTPGEVNVFAKLNDVVGEAQITVSNATLTQIIIENVESNISNQTSVKIEAIGIFSDGSKQIITDLVTFTSSDKSIANVTSGSGNAGILFPIKDGSFTLNASLGNILVSRNITISNATLSQIQLSLPLTSLAIGTQSKLDAIGLFSDGSSKKINELVNWQTSDSNTVSISNGDNQEGFITAKQTGTATISASFADISSSIEITVSDATLSQITITPQNIVLASGTHVQLRATGTFSDNHRQDISNLVLWSSSNEASVFVSNSANTNGFAFAADSGESTVTANYNNHSANTKITTTNATLDGINIVFDDDNTLAKGHIKALKAIGNYSDGSIQDISNQVSWQSSNESLCFISNNQTTSGKLTGISEGNCQITARLQSASSTLLFKITDAVLESISISPGQILLAKGSEIQLSAMGTYSDQSTLDITNIVIWQTTSPEIFINNTSPSKGKLTATVAGTFSLTASLNGTSESINITVTESELSSIAITPNILEISKGTSIQYAALGTFSDDTTQDISSQVLWSVSDEQAAIVSNVYPNNGNLNAIETGTITLSVELNGITQSSTINVVENLDAPKSISLNAQPYVIKNDGIDTTEILVNVSAIDSNQIVTDGTELSIRIKNGDGTLSTTSATTTDGKTSFNLSSTTKGIVTVEVDIPNTNISNLITLYVTDDFSEVIGKAAFAFGNVENEMVAAGAQMGFIIINLSNRVFELNYYRVIVNGATPILINNIDYPTDTDDKNFDPLEVEFQLYTSTQARANTFAAAFSLTEPKTGDTFLIPVGYLFHAGN